MGMLWLKPRSWISLHGGVAFQPGQRHQVHVVEGQLRQLTPTDWMRHMALGGVQTAGHVVQRHLEDVLRTLPGLSKCRSGPGRRRS